MDKVFTPTGPTYLVTSTTQYISPVTAGNTLRILNLAAAAQGLAYQSGNQPDLTYTAPSAGSPTATLQFEGATSEKISGLIGAQGVTLCASSSSGFEVTPGDGI